MAQPGWSPYLGLPFLAQNMTGQAPMSYPSLAMANPQPSIEPMSSANPQISLNTSDMSVSTMPIPRPEPGMAQALSFNFQSPLEREIENETLEKFRDLMKQRSGGIEGMQKQADALRAENEAMSTIQKVDLSPLAGLVDQWTGSNLAQQYKAPAKYQKNQEVIAKLEDAMRKEEGGLTSDQIAYLRLQQNAAQNKIMAEAARDQRFGASQELKKEDNLRKDVNKVTDEYKQTQGQLNMAEDMVRAGDSRQVGMIIASIARNVGEQKGALSDGDVARSFPPDVATNVAQLQAYLGRNEKISPQLQGALVELISNARRKSDGIFGEALNRRKAQYSAGSYAELMQPGRVGDVIFSESMRGTQPQAPQPASAGVMSPSDWLKQRRSKQ